MTESGMVVVDPMRSGGTKPDRGSRSSVGMRERYICISASGNVVTHLPEQFRHHSSFARLARQFPSSFPPQLGSLRLPVLDFGIGQAGNDTVFDPEAPYCANDGIGQWVKRLDGFAYGVCWVVYHVCR